MLHELVLTCYYLAPFFLKAIVIPCTLFWIAETAYQYAIIEHR